MKSLSLIRYFVVIVIVFTAGVSFSQDKVLSVKELVLCKQVTDKGPEGAANEFREDAGSVCCWTKMENTREQVKVTHSWYYGNRKKASFKPGIEPGSGTAYSCIEIKPEWLGMWTVRVSDVKGKLLESKSFFVKGIPDKKDRREKRGNTDYAGIGIKVRQKSKVKISSIKIGRKIRRGKLSGETKSVPSSWKKVFCWIDIPGVEKKSNVKFVWYYFGKKMAETMVRIKPPSSQAWAFKTMRPQYVGKWCVEVLDGEDVFIKEICFDVKQ